MKTYTCTILIQVADADEQDLISLAREDAIRNYDIPGDRITNAADAIAWLLDNSGIFNGMADIVEAECELVKIPSGRS